MTRPSRGVAASTQGAGGADLSRRTPPADHRAPRPARRCISCSVVELSEASLPRLAALGLDVPRYDRHRLRPAIIHIGVGGFHRAHLARYTDELAEQGSDWGIRGLGLLPGDIRMAQALAPQDHLYTLIERGPGPPATRVVGSLVDHRWAAERPSEAIDVLADP